MPLKGRMDLASGASRGLLSGMSSGRCERGTVSLVQTTFDWHAAQAHDTRPGAHVRNCATGRFAPLSPRGHCRPAGAHFGSISDSRGRLAGAHV